jgi:LCP family protein required for cell wall assembly
MILSLAVAVIGVLKLDVLPVRHFVILLAVEVAVITAVCVFQFRKKTSQTHRWLLIGAAAVVIAANLFIYFNSNATVSFIDKVDEVDENTLEYSVVVPTGTGIKLSPAGPLTVGVWSGDLYNDLVKPEVEKLCRPAFTNVDDVRSLLDEAEKKEIASAVVQSSFLNALEEEDPDAYGLLEVVATFTIRIPDVQTKTEENDITKPFLLYVSGNDTYGDITKVSRSDVNMLIAVDTVNHKMLLVNTPRDTYVQLHGTTGLKDKLTHAGNYGIEMSEQTLEDLYGMNIDYNIRINFSSIIEIVDTLGGVDVKSEYAFTSQGCSFVVGKNHLNGTQALAFSRARKNFGSGDLTRGQNQQRLIKAIFNKITSSYVLAHYNRILSELKDTFQTNISSQEIKDLVTMQLEDSQKWKLKSYTVKGTGKRAPTYSMGSQNLYVMEPDPESIAKAKKKIEKYLAGTVESEETK